jgi:hypothetical protein
MTVEMSLYREVAPRRRGALSVIRDAHPGAVVDSRHDNKNDPVVFVSGSAIVPAQRSFVHSNERTCVWPGSTKIQSGTRVIAFGPQNTVARHRELTRNLCTRPYFLVTWDTRCVPEEDHRMLRNKSQSRHVSGAGLAFDHGYTAVSIRDRLIDRAFVYCKNLRCKG